MVDIAQLKDLIVNGMGRFIGKVYASTSIGKVTIWLYLLYTYNESDWGFNNPICFTSGSMIKKGIWKYTIPNGYNMARIRFNTYSDGNTAQTAKFWNIRLIPEEYYVESLLGNGNPSLRIGNSTHVSAENIIEI